MFDTKRRKSISHWDCKLGTAAHIGEEARGHCEDINVGVPRYGNQFSWRLRAGDSLRLKIDLNLIVISTQKSMGARRGRTDSPLSCIRRFWGSSLGETDGSCPRARRSRSLAEEYFERLFFTRQYDKSQDIRILLETAHPVRGHKEAGPMNSSPRANATKARTLGGILLDAARVQASKLCTKTHLRFSGSGAMKFEKAPSRVKSRPEEGQQAMSHNK
jgi:hypothetical protein